MRWRPESCLQSSASEQPETVAVEKLKRKRERDRERERGERSVDALQGAKVHCRPFADADLSPAMKYPITWRRDMKYFSSREV